METGLIGGVRQRAEAKALTEVQVSPPVG